MKKISFLICVVLCCAFFSTAQSLKFVGTTPSNGEIVSSLNSIELEFDLSDVIATYGEGEWGICPNGLYVAALPAMEKTITLYEGDETGTLIERLNTAFRPNADSFQVGNKLILQFKSFEMKPEQEYTLVIKHEFYAGKQGNTSWETGSKLSFQNDPVVLKFYGASQVAKALTCESTSIGQDTKYANLSEDIKLKFNYDVEVLSGASAVITENNVIVATANSLTIDSTDSKSVLISFPETPLYNGHNYTLNVPAGIIGVAGETDVTNLEISESFEGSSFRSFGIGRVNPSNNSTTIPEPVIVPFKFPVIEGSNWSYGFANIEKAQYPMSVYKGTEENGELVATVNGTPDNTSLTFNLTNLEPGTLYTCVIAEGAVKAYAIGDPRESYLKDYISEKVVLTYTTPTLDQLGSLTVGCKDINDNDVVDHLGSVSFTCSGLEYGSKTYGIFVVDSDASNLPGIVYEITPSGEKEVSRFKFSKYALDNLIAEINTDLYEGRNYRVVIPAKTFKVYGSDFLGRYVFNEELSVNLVGAKSTESASEFTSGLIEGQKLSHVGVVSFYTDGEVMAADNAVLEIRNGEETVASAPVRVAQEDGYSHVYADFADAAHQPFVTESGATYAAVLPQGAVVEAANGVLTNKEYSVSFVGMASEAVYHNVTLSVDNAVAQTSPVEEGKTVSFQLSPVDDLWTVESVSNASLDAESGMYVTEPVVADVEVKAIFALVNPVDFDFTVGVEGVAAECSYRVYSEGERLVIEGVTAGDNIRIYTTGGTLMADKSVPSDVNTVSMHLANGIYIVAINGKTLKVKH